MKIGPTLNKLWSTPLLFRDVLFSFTHDGDGPIVSPDIRSPRRGFYANPGIYHPGLNHREAKGTLI